MTPYKSPRPPNKLLPFLKIERHIPVPNVAGAKTPRVPHAKWGLERLQINESVYMEGARAMPKKLFHILKRERGILFSSRVYRDEDGMPIGVRVWRVM